MKINNEKKTLDLLLVRLIVSNCANVIIPLSAKLIFVVSLNFFVLFALKFSLCYHLYSLFAYVHLAMFLFLLIFFLNPVSLTQTLLHLSFHILIFLITNPSLLLFLFLILALHLFLVLVTISSISFHYSLFFVLSNCIFRFSNCTLHSPFASFRQFIFYLWSPFPYPVMSLTMKVIASHISILFKFLTFIPHFGDIPKGLPLSNFLFLFSFFIIFLFPTLLLLSLLFYSFISYLFFVLLPFPTSFFFSFLSPYPSIFFFNDFFLPLLSSL